MRKIACLTFFSDTSLMKLFIVAFILQNKLQRITDKAVVSDIVMARNGAQHQQVKAEVAPIWPFLF